MINRKAYNEVISGEARYKEIMKVLTEATEPLSSRDVARRYVHPVCSSDVLTTGSILNTLSLAGLVEKIALPRAGRIPRFVFKLKG